MTGMVSENFKQLPVPGLQYPDYMGLKTFTNMGCKNVPDGNYYALT